MLWKLNGLAAISALTLFSVSPAPAQNTSVQGQTNLNTQTGTGSGGRSGSEGGVTSGPAAGRPTTLGTGGVTPTSPHQTTVTRSHGGATMQDERGVQGAGGTDTSVRPGASDAGAGVHQGNQQQRQ